MTERYTSGIITLRVSLEEQGVTPNPAYSASYTVIDETGQYRIIDAAVAIVSGEITIEIAEEHNLIPTGSISAARQVAIKLTAPGISPVTIKRTYLISPNTRLVVGTNSLMSQLKFAILYDEMPVNLLDGATEDEQVRALSNAYRNISKLRLRFEDAFYLAIAEQGETLDQVKSRIRGLANFTTLELIALEATSPIAHMQLCQAQIIEAEGVAGAYPVEDRRKSDMISESADQSARFFRTSRPIRMPVYRATADALTGLIDWDYTRAPQ